MNIFRSSVDVYVLYTIVRRLATPFSDWKAYKLGVIDDKGNFLIPKSQRTDEQYYSLTYLDIFVMNLKKLLQKIPYANSKLVTYAGALFLLREDRYIKYDLLSEDGTPLPANNTADSIVHFDEIEATAFKNPTLRRKKKYLQLVTR